MAKIYETIFFLSVRVKETYTSINQSTNKKETYISIEEGNKCFLP